MQLTLDYGRTGLTVNLPADRVVGPLAIRDVTPLADPATTLDAALQNPIGTRPLAELARGRKDACILICDITRPVPNRLILPPILQTLEDRGHPARQDHDPHRHRSASAQRRRRTRRNGRRGNRGQLPHRKPPRQGP